MSDPNDLPQRDLAVVWHPCTQMKDHESFAPIAVREAHGCWITDMEGRRYLDAISSWWVNTLGHNHARLNTALARQLEKFAHVIFAGFTHEAGVNFAERLVAAAPPGLRHVAFAGDGSSAVEMALKMSFQYWRQSGHPEKTKFLSITGAYHGETLGALAVGGVELYREIYKPLLIPVHQAAGPDCFRCPYGKRRESCDAECIESVEKTLAQHGHEICAVIIEPLVQGAAGMRIYSPEYLKRLRALCDRHRVHLIADEIMTGYGRTGRMWAVDHAGIAPDLMCLAKGLTAGYLPMSVVLATEDIYRAFYDDYATLKTFFHSHSHSGNALACAVAAETLAIYEEEGIVGGLPPKAAALAAALAPLKDHPNVGEVRQQGMIAAVELVRDRRTNAEFPLEERVGWRIAREALSRGVLLRPLGSVVYFMPPLTVTPEETALMGRVAKEAVEAVEAVLG